MKQQRLFVRLAGLAAAVTCLSVLLHVLSLSTGGQDGCYPLWLGFTLGGELLLSLLLRRERSLRFVVVVEIVSFLLQLLTAVLIYGAWAGWGGMFLALLFWGVGYVQLYKFLIPPVKLQQLMDLLDADLLVLLISLLMFAGGALEAERLIPPGIALLLLLLACREVRMPSSAPRSRGAGNLVFLPTVLVCLAAGVLVWKGGEGIRAALIAVRDALLAVLHFAWNAIVRFLNWLFSLFPADTGGPIEAEESISFAAGAVEDLPEADSTGLYVLAVLIALGVLISLIVFLRTHGRFRLHRPKPLRTVARISRPRRKGALRTLLHRLWQAIHYRICCITRQSTARGSFAWVDARLRRIRQGRRREETCRQFLTRAAALHPQAAAQLAALADALDAELYAPSSVSGWTAAEASALHRAWHIK